MFYLNKVRFNNVIFLTGVDRSSVLCVYTIAVDTGRGDPEEVKMETWRVLGILLFAVGVWVRILWWIDRDNFRFFPRLMSHFSWLCLLFGAGAVVFYLYKS